MRSLLTALALVAASVAAPAAQADPGPAVDPALALTPPMGFNNWNTTGCDINEQMIRDMADIFVSKGLKDVGYQYVNVDDCWADLTRDPATGRLRNHPTRFPSGMKALADYIHARGLKFGIYTSAGTLTCAKTMPGSLDHEEIDAQTFADWGVDYLKYDNCNNEGRPALERYTKMRDALKKTGRPIVYSICEWGQNKPWEWGKGVGHLWRTTGDINDTWSKTVEIIKLNAPLDAYAGPGHWNDPDMLEVGNGKQTTTEYQSHFALWSIMAAPLLIGADLRKISPEHLDILRNKEIIAINQDRLGVQGKVIYQKDGHWVFVKPLANGDKAVALFNESEVNATISTTAREIGLPRSVGYTVRDLWQHKNFQSAGKISASLPPHGTAIFRVKASQDWYQHEPAIDTSLDIAQQYAGIPSTITPAGEPFVATVTATNQAPIPVLDASTTFRAPAGWKVEKLSSERAPVLLTSQSVQSKWKVTPPAGAVPGTHVLNGSLGATWVGRGKLTRPVTSPALVPVAPPPGGSLWASDVTFTTERSGYGPVERDRSNGGYVGGDGKTLTINGKTYEKGLGTHANAELILYVGGRCTSFSSDVGIDDERDVNQQGSAIFEIWADGTRVASSGLRTWKDDAVSISGSLQGAKFLRLVVNDSGDGVRFDRGDFAGAKLTC
ncbi:alpha-galactosidase [Lentzea atacamensis]|uniref:Alpha-galactosidase n=1 Tax=Lentzea atacamensis TaxID=531938 RepID=A0ABX9EJN8_9PSEU|nr:NPCBM/NEW2 domain-containing protein [Lentzea atacamensis]RAS71402.1 alpha-galactosidase [Lentzea atacamensis]